MLSRMSKLLEVNLRPVGSWIGICMTQYFVHTNSNMAIRQICK